MLILSDGASTIAEMVAAIDQGGVRGDAFSERIAQAYQAGAGLLLCADMEHIVKDTAGRTGGFNFGVDNAKFLVLERKDIASKTQNIASLSFSEQRKGVMACLAHLLRWRAWTLSRQTPAWQWERWSGIPNWWCKNCSPWLAVTSQPILPRSKRKPD